MNKVVNIDAFRPKGSPLDGGDGGGHIPTMETRVALLEQTAQDTKTILREMNGKLDKLSDGLAQVNNKITDGLNQANNNLSDGLAQVNNKITDGLNQANNNLSDGLAQVNNKITDGLAQVNSKLDVQNEKIPHLPTYAAMWGYLVAFVGLVAALFAIFEHFSL
ncbi:hypothetical protein FAI40_10175 [Acetobacteraceae bacterium]|nr:hypothetical protein FAI40_10175 [Acetobacteraceae bacterium]